MPMIPIILGWIIPIVVAAGILLLVAGTFRKPERTREQMSGGTFPDAAGSSEEVAQMSHPATTLDERLTELDDLLRQGRITDMEHTAARARLLGTF